MTTTANATQTGSTSFTWGSADFAWNDATYGVKDWANAVYVSVRLDVGETIAASDKNTLGFGLRKSETMTVAEALRRQATIRQVESLVTGESFDRQVSFSRQFDESAHFDDLLSNGVSKHFNESVGVVDGLRFDFVLNVLRSLNIAEDYIDNIAFTIRVSESIGIGEILGKSVSLPKSETLGVVDALRHEISLSVAELVAFVEALGKSAVIRHDESFGADDALAKAFVLPHDETLAVAEFGFEKHIEKVILQSINLAEVFGRTISYHIATNEGFSVAEALSKATTLQKTEALSFLEEYRRRGNAVLSDMILSSAQLDLASFQKIVDAGHSPGFANFKDFIPGDYDYRYALFRAVLKSSNDDRARLAEMKVVVDVPDVFDRGSAVITPAEVATGVRVNFTRPFNVAPEITMNIKGGTVVSIPRLVGEPDTTGFTAVLVDMGGNNVAGTFTWSAHGY